MNKIAVAKTPFMKVILPAGAGMGASVFLDLLPWAPLVCLIICVSSSVWLRKYYGAGLYVWLSVFFFFLWAGESQTPKGELPPGERIVVTVQIS